MLLDDMGAWLGVAGWPIFLDGLPGGSKATPPGPDLAIGLIEYGGREGMRTHDKPGIAYEYPRFQVITRSNPNDPRPARVLAEQAYQRLMLIKNITIGNAPYLSIYFPLGGPVKLLVDDNECAQFVFSCEAFKGLSVAA